MQKKNKPQKVFKKIIGIFLIVLGIFGLFLPLLQGILLILAGLTLLESDIISKYFKKKIKK
jgi:uncharacterized membrane protein YbaN (DUF454 family)